MCSKPGAQVSERLRRYEGVGAAIAFRAKMICFFEVMITCDRCKTENLDGSQYCDECGAPLRPNGRPGPVQRRPAPGNAAGNNGNHAPSPGAPEFAAGRVSAGLSLSALRTA